ncbi:MAG: hypothetical protein M3Y77_00755 [Actinomycetota bacterium]|nr:hypothetical protein [Actinomycetota bacterium]
MAQSNDPMARAQAALEKIADRLPELPKPVLAAIGAADLAGRQLSDLLNSLADRAGIKSAYLPGRDEVVDELRSAANDLPSRVQQLATNLPDRAQALVADLPGRAKELADQLEQFATRLPGRVQKFTDELPGKAKEFSEQMQPDQLKQSADAYRQLIGSVLSTLAGRGEKAWDDIRNTGPVPGSVVDAGSAKAAASAPKSAAKRASKRAPKVADKPAAATSMPRPARRKPTPKTSSEKTSMDKPAADSKGVTKSAAAKAARPTAVSGPRPPRPRRGTFPSASS